MQAFYEWVRDVPLAWYINLYSNGLNQNCDICWGTYIAVMHYLYGELNWLVAGGLFIINLCIKKSFLTDYDKQVVDQ